MKILQISSTPITYPGGTEKVVLDLSKELSKKHEVTILQTTLYEKNKKYEKISNIGKIKIITCKNDRFLGGFGYSKEFKKTLKKIWKDYDIIHVHGHGRFTSNFTLRCIGRKKPLIYTAHGFFHDKKHKTIKKLHDLIIKRSIKKAKFCTALTKLDYPKYKRLGIKEKNIVEIPNGIGLSLFNKKSKIKKEANKILYVGRIHKSKGLLSVFQSIKDIEAKFVIVGKDAGYKEELLKYIKENNLSKKIEFKGELTEKKLLREYLSSEFFILFSDWEGFGIVVLEAMASGIPVIVSDKGSLPYLVKNNKTGFVVRNKKELKKAMEYLLKNKKQRHSLGKNAKEFANQFDWKKITKKYEKIYNEAKKLQ